MDVETRTRDEARRLTWDFWVGDIEAAAVTDAGRPTLVWAIDVLRRTFGEDWITENALTSQTVPFLQLDWYPLGNPRVVTAVIELACQLELASHQPGLAGLLADAKRIRSNPNAVVRDFQHLLLELEVAAFAVLRGWTVSHERPLSSGRKPDLWLSRGGIEYVVEVTALSFDREFREIETWTDKLFRGLRAVEARHRVEIASCVDEVLDEQATAQWLAEIELAAGLTANDGTDRTVRAGPNTAEVGAAGRLPQPRSTGPMQVHDVWARVAVRLREKAEQTRGGPPAWLRLDDVGALFHLTDWSARPLTQRLELLAGNIAVALGNAPHVHGAILTGAVQYAATGAVGETAWQTSGRLGAAPDQSPRRHQVAEGPVALRRMLPANRQRLSFVIPTRHDHILLPSGIGLEPGLWYDDEPEWLDIALRRLGRPRLDGVIMSRDIRRQ